MIKDTGDSEYVYTVRLGGGLTTKFDLQFLSSCGLKV